MYRHRYIYKEPQIANVRQAAAIGCSSPAPRCSHLRALAPAAVNGCTAAQVGCSAAENACTGPAAAVAAAVNGCTAALIGCTWRIARCSHPGAPARNQNNINISSKICTLK